jgi:hypothetical protein
MRTHWFQGALVAVLLCCLAGEARAQKKPVKATREWSGSVANEALQQSAPAVVVSEKGLKKLWEDWKIEGKVPEVDFKKEIVVVSTSRGSKLNLSAVLDDKGNLLVLGFGTRDLRPGFRYVLAAIPREGVKTVSGKELPKE